MCPWAYSAVMSLTSLAQRIGLTQPDFHGDRAKEPQKTVKDPRVLTELGHSVTQAGARWKKEKKNLPQQTVVTGSPFGSPSPDASKPRSPASSITKRNMARLLGWERVLSGRQLGLLGQADRSAASRRVPAARSREAAAPGISRQDPDRLQVRHLKIRPRQAKSGSLTCRAPCPTTPLELSDPAGSTWSSSLTKLSLRVDEPERTHLLCALYQTLLGALKDERVICELKTIRTQTHIHIY